MNNLVFIVVITLLASSGCNRSNSDDRTANPPKTSSTQIKKIDPSSLGTQTTAAEEISKMSARKTTFESSEIFSKAPISPEESRTAWLNLQSENLEWRFSMVSDDASKAFTNLYGGLEWNDKGLAEYFQGKAIGYVTPKFEERFSEEGKEKLLVLGYITPEPIEDYSCHACVPLLGGAIFIKQGNGWVAESSNRIIGYGDVLEIGRMGLILIGPQKYGVALYFTDAHQGYQDVRAEILVPHNGVLGVGLETGYSEKPEVDDSPQNVDIKFETGRDTDYFDAVVQLQFNDGTIENSTHQNQTAKYQLRNGKYELVGK